MSDQNMISSRIINIIITCMQIQRKKRRLNCCIIWSLFLGLAISICMVIFILDSNSTKDQINYLKKITYDSLIIYYHCDSSICTGKISQSFNHEYCCNIYGDFCVTKWSCLDQRLKSLDKAIQIDQIILFTMGSALAILIVVSSVFCYTQAKSIENSLHDRENEYAVGQGNRHSPRRRDSSINQKRQRLIQSFSYNDSENTCCICLQTFTEQQKAAMLGCGHLYHSKCIKNWTAVSKQCPICRSTKDGS